jgi:hypothetical protein
MRTKNEHRVAILLSYDAPDDASDAKSQSGDAAARDRTLAGGGRGSTFAAIWPVLGL